MAVVPSFSSDDLDDLPSDLKARSETRICRLIWPSSS